MFAEYPCVVVIRLLSSHSVYDHDIIHVGKLVARGQPRLSAFGPLRGITILRQILRIFQNAKTVCQGLKQKKEHGMYCPHHLAEYLAICILNIMMIVVTLTVQKPLYNQEMAAFHSAAGRLLTSNSSLNRNTPTSASYCQVSFFTTEASVSLNLSKVPRMARTSSPPNIVFNAGKT